MWRAEIDEVKAHYYHLAKLEKEQHHRRHPDYKCEPRKSSEIKRRKTKTITIEHSIIDAVQPTDMATASAAVSDAPMTQFVLENDGSLATSNIFNVTDNATVQSAVNNSAVADNALAMFNFDIAADTTNHWADAYDFDLTTGVVDNILEGFNFDIADEVDNFLFAEPSEAYLAFQAKVDSYGNEATFSKAY